MLWPLKEGCLHVAKAGVFLLIKIQPFSTHLGSKEKLHVSCLLLSQGKMLFVHGELHGKARKMDCSDASL